MFFCLRYLTDPTTNRLTAAFWATKRMRELAQGHVRFFSFDTTHNLNWQDMYTGVFVTENLHGETEVLGYSLQVGNTHPSHSSGGQP